MRRTPFIPKVMRYSDSVCYNIWQREKKIENPLTSWAHVSARTQILRLLPGIRTRREVSSSWIRNTDMPKAHKLKLENPSPAPARSFGFARNFSFTFFILRSFFVYILIQFLPLLCYQFPLDSVASTSSSAHTTHTQTFLLLMYCRHRVIIRFILSLRWFLWVNFRTPEWAPHSMCELSMHKTCGISHTDPWVTLVE